jgi:glycosyltransferase involved in cell wall biosynthesis
MSNAALTLARHPMTRVADPSPSPATPLVSIGFPVYNRAELLVPALDSLLRQTYAHLEIIVCDNASTDGTAEKCREYARRDPRVKYFRNDTNIGPRGSTGNFGRVLALSSGKYFMWCASDDSRPPGVIADAVAALEHNPAAVMAHGAVRLYLESEDRYLEVANAMDLRDARPGPRIAAFTRHLQHNAILYGLYRRDAIVNAILPKHYADDYLFCLQACLLGPFEYVRGTLLTYRQRYTRISPMYPRDVTSPTVLLLYRGVKRSKCWTALLMGVYYLLRLRSVPFGDRMSGCVAHFVSFTRRYRRELATELLFLACTPLHRLLRPLAPVGVRLRAALRGVRMSQS